ncbi:MAG: hypothetical protein D4Q77_02325 [Methanothrix sp.]|nr:MAG: hypothetical protein D4Q77_02325 [Methanothrix sp.]
MIGAERNSIKEKEGGQKPDEEGRREVKMVRLLPYVYTALVEYMLFGLPGELSARYTDQDHPPRYCKIGDVRTSLRSAPEAVC